MYNRCIIKPTLLVWLIFLDLGCLISNKLPVDMLDAYEKSLRQLELTLTSTDTRGVASFQIRTVAHPFYLNWLKTDTWWTVPSIFPTGRTAITRLFEWINSAYSQSWRHIGTDWARRWRLNGECLIALVTVWVSAILS